MYVALGSELGQEEILNSLKGCSHQGQSLKMIKIQYSSKKILLQIKE